ncbi:MAG TPA: ABC transporter ATP-binding protein [Rhizobium sp.]
MELVSVSKSYSEREVVSSLSLRLPKGSLLTLLGPSGCGKTTVLRMIAGFVEPSAGDVLIDDVNVTRMIPEKRPTSMMFQSYALFPHMNVFDNVAFGLRLRGVSATDVRKRVDEILDQVDLSALSRHFPSQLSGGQQQRTALARSLVIGPKVLLLDEPFAALDRDLRERMQMELRKLQQDLAITMVVVTHDQQEAQILSDYVAVMNKGRIEQIGEPSLVYDRPATRFVASFMGFSNVLPATISVEAGEPVIDIAGRRLAILPAAVASRGAGPATAAIRREEIIVLPSDVYQSQPSAGTNLLPGKVKFVRRIGSQIALEVDTPIGLLHVLSPRQGEAISPGSDVMLAIPASQIVVVEL